MRSRSISLKQLRRIPSKGSPPDSRGAEDACQSHPTRLRRNSARRKRSSLSLSEGAATGQAFLQTFERRVLQQDKCVAHVVRIGFGTFGQHGANGRHEPGGPPGRRALSGFLSLVFHPGLCAEEANHIRTQCARPFPVTSPIILSPLSLRSLLMPLLLPARARGISTRHSVRLRQCNPRRWQSAFPPRRTNPDPPSPRSAGGSWC